MARTHGLSKSRLTEWRQCPRRLWLKVHRPDLIETSVKTERAFQVGFAVGAVAQQQHPDGVLIETGNLRDDLRMTRELLANRPDAPLFEATFERNGLLVRVDLLLPERGGYRMVEVKAATSVKDYYLEDAAIQRWVVGQAVRLTGVEIAHVNNQFIYPGGEDYLGLLNRVSVDDRIEALGIDVPVWMAGARKTLGGDEPTLPPVDQCKSPFACPFIGHCNVGKPVTDYPISAIPRISAEKIEHFEAQGIVDIRQIPDGTMLTDNQARVWRITQTGEPELLQDARTALDALPWPRYYLDFETASMPVPIWAGTRPYQKLPVQWSCHVESQDGNLEHFSFLAEGHDDPRRSFASRMVDVLGADGPIFVYNRSFELDRIKELARDFQEIAEPLRAIASRVVDLMPLTRESYYHPDMLGSWSIKAVLPTIASDLDYSSMDVGDGGDAEASWLEILHPETAEDRRAFLRKALADYCALDTLAMVRLSRFLIGGADSQS